MRSFYRLFRIVLDQGINTELLEFISAFEEGQLDDKGALDHRAAKLRHQFGGRRSGAAGGDQIIGDNDASVGL